MAACRAQYHPDLENGTIIATLPKLNRGEFFEGASPVVTTVFQLRTLLVERERGGASKTNPRVQEVQHRCSLLPLFCVPCTGLDLTTALLRPSELLPLDRLAAANRAAPGIQELASETFAGAEEAEGAPSAPPSVDTSARPGAGAVAPQPLLPPMLRVVEPLAGAADDGAALPGLIGELKVSSRVRYGFQRRYFGVFKHLQDELVDVLSFDPEELPEELREAHRVAAEDADFDMERYCGDEYQGCAEDPLGVAALAFVPHWESAGYSAAEFSGWSEEETTAMQRLANRDFLMDPVERATALSGVLSVVMAYCYEERMTGGDFGVESAWTVAKLSAALSWLQPLASSRDAVAAGLRRVLCYPYLRSLTLAQRTASDAATIFAHGKRCILRCLLQVAATFAEAHDHQGFYLLNKVLVHDQIVFLQRLPDALLATYAGDVATAVEGLRGAPPAEMLGEVIGAKVSEASAWACGKEEDGEDNEDNNDSEVV